MKWRAFTFNSNQALNGTKQFTSAKATAEVYSYTSYLVHFQLELNIYMTMPNYFAIKPV